jgi:hypothetical protein
VIDTSFGQVLRAYFVAPFRSCSHDSMATTPDDSLKRAP